MMNLSEKLKTLTLPTAIEPCFSFDKVKKEFIEKEVTAKITEKNGVIYCCSDSPFSDLFSSYECEIRGRNWISEDLDKWAIDNFGKGAYWEWENATKLCLVI